MVFRVAERTFHGYGQIAMDPSTPRLPGQNKAKRNAKRLACLQVRLCASCGYDLRGATDSDGLCPECGATYSKLQFHVPVSRIRHYFGFLEDQLVASVGLFILFVGVFLSWQLTGARTLAIIAGLIAFLWFWIVWSYGRSCEWQYSWLHVLVLYHLAGSVGALAIGVIWWCGINLAAVFLGSPTPPTDPQLYYLLIGVVALASIPFVTLPIYRSAERRRKDKQRDLAARLAMRRNSG